MTMLLQQNARTTHGFAVHPGTDVDQDRGHNTHSRHDTQDRLQELFIGWALMQMYGQHVGAEDELDTVQPRRTLPERLAAMLLERSVRDKHDRITVETTAHDLARELGAQRETIAAILRAFRRQKLIDISYRSIILRDMISLSELSDTSPQQVAA